jgi:hypothetical protein
MAWPVRMYKKSPKLGVKEGKLFVVCVDREAMSGNDDKNRW